MTVHHNLITNGDIGVYVKGYSQNVYNNTLWGASNDAVYWGSGGYTDINTLNNLSNVNHFDGTNVSNNRYQTANQFTNSAAGDYTLTANIRAPTKVQRTSGPWTTARRFRASPTATPARRPTPGPSSRA